MKKMKFRRDKIFSALFVTLCLPGILSATCSSKSNFTHAVDLPSSKSKGQGSCLHGFCTESDICECNPCWSGPTCQDYVDKFSPRFLAEEPFFILDYERLHHSPSPRSTSSKFQSSLINTNSYDRVPLFRIESSDDDLGLTCQLGEIGPSATCPCATPRYAVVGPSTRMFYTDAETGDVFLRDGYALQPKKHYFITLQVSALTVKARQVPWKEEIMVKVYVRSSEDQDKIGIENLFSESLKLRNVEALKESDNYASLVSKENGEKTKEYLSRRRSSNAEKIESNSVFRYKRQTKERIDPEVHDKMRISFSPNASQLQSFSSDDEIKVGIRIRLPVTPLSSAFPLNFSIEISSKIYGKYLDVGICSANISSAGSIIEKLPTPIFSFSKNREIPDTVTLNFENIRKISRESYEIELEVMLYPYEAFSKFQKLQNHFTVLNQFEQLRVAAEISFPLEEPRAIIKGRAEKIKTFIQFPIRRKTTKTTRTLRKPNHRPLGDRECPIEENQRTSFPLHPPDLTKERKAVVRSPEINIIGPSEIPRGSTKSYIIRVTVEDDLTRELKLSLHQIGNLTEGPTISVKDLQLIKAGEKFLRSCCPANILRHGSLLVCTHSSSLKSRTQTTPQGCSLHTTLFNFPQGESGRGGRGVESHDDPERNVLEFQGIIYGLPEAPIGSEFGLQAEADVNGESRQGLMMMMTPSRLSFKSQQHIDKFTRSSSNRLHPTAPVTFIGKIGVEEKQGRGEISVTKEKRNQTQSFKASTRNPNYEHLTRKQRSSKSRHTQT